jgi:hypothetical protein
VLLAFLFLHIFMRTQMEGHTNLLDTVHTLWNLCWAVRCLLLLSPMACCDPSPLIAGTSLLSQ